MSVIPIHNQAQWQSVAGQFVIPTLFTPSGLRAAYISVWVGVDGFTCPTAAIKAGVDIEIRNGVASYFGMFLHRYDTTPAEPKLFSAGWDEYFPGQYNVETNSISFTAGNTIDLIAIANASNLHEAEIQNLSARVSVLRAFAPGPALCQADAVWGIEAWQTGDARLPFSLQFTNAQATRFDGTVVGPGGATVLNTEENGTALASCSTTTSTVTCSFPQPR